MRARISCADAGEYRRARAAEFATRGVLIRSNRVRPIGARVRLKIELLDGTFGYDGEAVVAVHVDDRGPPGYLLRLAGVVAPHAAASAVRTAPEPPADHGEQPGRLSDFLFSDLNLPDSPALPLRVEELRALTPPPGPAPRLATLPPSRLARGADAAPVPVCERSSRTERASPSLELPAAYRDAPEDDPPARPAPRFRPQILALLQGVHQGVHRARRVAPIAAAVILGVAVGGGTLALVPGSTRGSGDLAAALRRADDRLRSGRLAGPADDSALDHLVAARAAAPNDPRLARRLKLLSDLFGDLGERALARGDLEEATAHFQAKLRADPGSDVARARLHELAGRTATPPPARWARAGARR